MRSERNPYEARRSTQGRIQSDLMTHWIQRFLYMIFLGGILLSVGETAVSQAPTSEVIRLVNEVRTRQGLAPYTYNAQLAQAAQMQANYMAINNIYSHTGTGGTTPQDRANSVGYQGYVVENIVGGWQMTPAKGVIWWENSPIHYQGMTSTRHTQIGAGYATGHDQHFYVIVMGRPSNAPIAPAPAPEREQAPAPIIVQPIVLASPDENGLLVHTVGTGQSLWMIAAYYEVPLTDLLLFNNLTENAFVQPGDEIVVQLAEGQPPPPTATPPFTHIVQAGETLVGIATQYNLTVDTLLWYNSLNEQDFIQPGDELIVRLREGQSPPPTPTPPITHIVQTGDTLLGIAITYGITLDQLLTLNGLTADTVLQLGQQLFVREVTAVPLIITPTTTPTVTPTNIPTTPTATATPTIPALQLTPSPQPATTANPVATMPPSTASNTSSNGRTILIATIIGIIGLTALAGAIIIAVRHNT